ncbi:uncharacterized protein METZ01_LOCUS309131 [marine metagenome]|uniref:DUF481 domain-containing protein n=1 Tax=marine metagenome TaxID=408172 RepID=A0A382N7U4_9ZZZZ
MTKTILFYTLLFASLNWSQINTESIRGDHKIQGLSQNMDLSFAYISGNSNIMFFNGSYRLDYTAKSNWYGLFVIKYDRAFEKSQVDFTNKGFGHLRTVKSLFTNIQMEGFLQKEFNYFIDLENRELIGGGLRFNFFKQFFIATGAMHEKEVYQKIIEKQNFMKSTSYINYSVQIMDKVTIQNILYYQFKFKTIDNYRILWDGKISVQGSDWLSLYINCNYRYDVSTINPNANLYFEITNGLSFRFK